MIWNIIDQRVRPYRWKRVNAVVEPVEHDNSCPDADQAEEAGQAVDCARRDGISVHEAIAWGERQPFALTLYLYDADKVTSDNGTAHNGAKD
ncbi:hypothetical protein [Ensifer sp.]|jgi:hypothetical protein|uniref:hypothetical protein n=1 Tax=Ensifer sp. TaxID=1872086 RepID=UPI002E0E1D45|nr:hypothetical protein [Ensifer sp.]